MRTNFKMMLLAMATMGLSSCSDKLDNDVVPEDEISNGYISFTVNMMSDEMGTRADDAPDTDIDPGSENEWAITTEHGANVVYFFSDNGIYQDMATLTILSNPNGTQPDSPGHENTAGEMVFNARVKDAKVGKCIIILNGDPTQLGNLGITKNTTTLKEFLQLTDKTTLGRYGNYFTMSTAVYVDKIEGTGPTARATVNATTKITSDNIKPTPEEANQNKVMVHVERIAAKFSIDFADDIKSGDYLIHLTGDNSLYVRTTSDVETGAEKKEWGIKVRNWGVNGTETETYWVKNLDNGSNITYGAGTITMSPLTFGKWNYTHNTTTGTTGWNSTERVRSYWAVDPHYNKEPNTAYPEQFRSADGLISYEKEEAGVADGTGVVLNYRTYSDIDGALSAAQYAPENTFAYNTTEGSAFKFQRYAASSTTGAATYFDFEGEDYRRVSTQVLVTAQLLSDDEIQNNTPAGSVANKFYYNGAYWKGDGKNYELIKYMVKSVLAEYGQTLYTDANCQNEFNVDNFNSTNLISNYFELVSAKNIQGGDGRVMLNTKSTSTSSYKLYRKTDNGRGTLVTQSDLFSNISDVGTAKRYTNGKMYYAIPVKHMAQIIPEQTQDGVTSPHLYNVGSYGVVRNHWYKTTIKSISKPGTPVDNPDDEVIIPGTDPDDSGIIAFSIFILPWHTLNQDVEL